MLYFSVTKRAIERRVFAAPKTGSDDSSFMKHPLCSKSYDPAEFRR